MNRPAANPILRIDFQKRTSAPCARSLAQEAPVAFEYNGLGYAVMMASPQDLIDYAVGFTLAEGLATNAGEIETIEVAEVARGTIVRIALPAERGNMLQERLRLRLVEGSCGLCGLESIEEVLRPLQPLAHTPAISREAIAIALANLRDHQPAGRETGAMHAAAFCDGTGRIVAAREDIGRHNALDKLVGHLAREAGDPATGFILLSARCSYELVEKTVRARCPALVTISAASDLAVERAAAARLTLVSLARSDAALVMNDPYGCFA
ncbi:formate dehydrogenase accessory sulfurtransferase FdhD [Erythrobacter litoralis]|uniref:formate dehydrogenase accessory sulfurtransferase FdhD n=1 Tax=Erythrobacter litoralis TaxID=39960 RepID=UPI002434F4AF|nr:formate dehydrogenase accessory sulfurtransferase FdhD [Erythrobacter litoralis]MDG6080242.1 formate dehydrogenase accessory sulfurtransferase FdhD [Erythrobacter litoralis]